MTETIKNYINKSAQIEKTLYDNPNQLAGIINALIYSYSRSVHVFFMTIEKGIDFFQNINPNSQNNLNPPEPKI